jgi:hypothetical protein
LLSTFTGRYTITSDTRAARDTPTITAAS